MKTQARKILLLAVTLTVAAAGISLTSCGKKNIAKAPYIGVFVPGIMADSPTYAKLAQGVISAVEEYNAKISDENFKVKYDIMEVGTNQAEWSVRLTEATALGKYDVIVSSNESLPEIAEPITRQFPDQKYIIMHGKLENNSSIYCINYDQKEEAYITGYLAGLYSRSKKVALVAAQEYPAMNNIFLPYYAKGAKDAGDCSCAFRIVGNWYDASKGAEITDALNAEGVDVILPICGGASQGVISSAREHGIHLNFFDENAFVKAPGTIISSCATKQMEATKEAVLQYLEGKTPWGTTKDVGIREGYIEFVQDDPLYEEAVPEEIRIQVRELIESLQSGKISAPVL